ncbi:ECF-type sigma factor, partial [Alistipes onderdonkii]|nr:ECF-type sigma factor [Alistipes onderdonkii]
IDASRAKRPPAVPLDVDVPDRSPGADPAAACAGSEVGVLIRALDPELREVVELRFDQGFKVGEIAQVLGVSRFAVNRRLNRALVE